MNLIGLSPEEINNTVKTDIGQNALLINAANALADRNSAIAQTAAYTKAHQPNLMSVTLDGKDYNIRIQDFPYMWKTMKEAERDADMEIFHFQGGIKIPVRRQDVPAMINAITNRNKAPSEIAKNQANTANLNSQTSERETMLPYNISQKEQDIAKTYNETAKIRDYDIPKTAAEIQNLYQNQRKTGFEADRIDTQNAAINALTGVVNPQELFSGENLGNTLKAGGSGTVSALANKVDIGNKGNLNDNQFKQYQDKLTALNYSFKKEPKEVTLGDAEAYNALAAKTNAKNAWVIEDGKPEQITLPISIKDFNIKLKDKNVTLQNIADEAVKRDMTTQEFLPYVIKSLEK